MVDKQLELLMTLALQSERAMADIAGSIFITFLTPMAGPLAIALPAAGRRYHNATKGQ